MNSPNNKNEGLARNSNPIDRERQPSHSPENASSLAKINQALKFIFVSVCVTTLGSIVFSIQAKTIAEYFSIFGVALLIQVSSLLAGMLTGFLFGIPRSLQTDSPPIVTENNGTSKQLSQPGFRGNTNLEQISDWLTKILVGVGLTQIGSISSALGSFGKDRKSVV